MWKSVSKAWLAAPPAAEEMSSSDETRLKTDDAADAGVVSDAQRPPPLPALHINASEVSVSGISSGADFAVYFSVSHSASIMGSAIFAVRQQQQFSSSGAAASL
jgi:hypothetical protein